MTDREYGPRVANFFDLPGLVIRFEKTRLHQLVGDLVSRRDEIFAAWTKDGEQPCRVTRADGIAECLYRLFG